MQINKTGHYNILNTIETTWISSSGFGSDTGWIHLCALHVVRCLLLYLAALHMALFSASSARFSAGDKSLSADTLSSGLCTRILSWCLRSALAVRMGAADSPGYTGIRLRTHVIKSIRTGARPTTVLFLKHAMILQVTQSWSWVSAPVWSCPP